MCCECIRQASDAVRTALALVYLLSPKSEAQQSSTSDSDSESTQEAAASASSTVLTTRVDICKHIRTHVIIYLEVVNIIGNH